jgi:hypothetical protein
MKRLFEDASPPTLAQMKEYLIEATTTKAVAADINAEAMFGDPVSRVCINTPQQARLQGLSYSATNINNHVLTLHYQGFCTKSNRFAEKELNILLGERTLVAVPTEEAGKLKVHWAIDCTALIEAANETVTQINTQGQEPKFTNCTTIKKRVELEGWAQDLLLHDGDTYFLLVSDPINHVYQAQHTTGLTVYSLNKDDIEMFEQSSMALDIAARLYALCHASIIESRENPIDTEGQGHDSH